MKSKGGVVGTHPYTGQFPSQPVLYPRRDLDIAKIASRPEVVAPDDKRVEVDEVAEQRERSKDTGMVQHVRFGHKVNFPRLFMAQHRVVYRQPETGENKNNFRYVSIHRQKQCSVSYRRRITQNTSSPGDHLQCYNIRKPFCFHCARTPR